MTNIEKAIAKGWAKNEAGDEWNETRFWLKVIGETVQGKALENALGPKRQLWLRDGLWRMDDTPRAWETDEEGLGWALANLESVMVYGIPGLVLASIRVSRRSPPIEEAIALARTIPAVAAALEGYDLSGATLSRDYLDFHLLDGGA